MRGWVPCLAALLATSVAAEEAPHPEALKPLPAVSAAVLDDGTTSYVPNGDFSLGTAKWQFHGGTKTVVSLVADDLPPGVKGQALRYAKADGASATDYHVNHVIRVPAPGTYVLSYWCKTTAPLVPLVVVRKNWNRAQVEPAKIFEIQNDGQWKHYENTFRIDPAWPTTFALQIIPGSKGIPPGQGAMGIGFDGKTWFAGFRCVKKPADAAAAR